MTTLDKALDILELFFKHKGEIGIVELSRLSGLNISAVQRITATLVKRGYLNQPQKGKKYSLGLKLLQHSDSIQQRIKIRDVALPFLYKLNRITDETVNLAILDNYEAVLIEVVESNHHLRMFHQVGDREMLHCTAVGKAFLAHMSERELEAFLKSKGLPYRTENTITNFSKLQQELAMVRQEGVALDNEEFTSGAKCIASPIKDGNDNIVAAVSISGPSMRIHGERIKELKSLVKSHALGISQATGYRGE